jgi:hypothetical protein
MGTPVHYEQTVRSRVGVPCRTPVHYEQTVRERVGGPWGYTGTL